MKNAFTIFFTSLLSGVITLSAYKIFFEKNSTEIDTTEIVSDKTSINSENTNELPNFTTVAKNTINHVVHVKNVSFRNAPSNPILEYFYGSQSGRQIQPQIGTGSGIIISADGYIVTNNHVIKGANQLEITLNDNRTFPAQLIGTDPKTDIALLKIETTEDLAYATFGDSDLIEVGDWVLAVGNPYNLNSTVTAGIVSAKARNLSSDDIQSFIQTDAAVNPGNSGGALVNTRGELIGINTLISSQTGSYVGYSFAVPSNIAKKIITDLLEFGNVKQGTLGVQGYELNKQIANHKNIKINQGFYIESVIEDSGAANANIKPGDVIVKVDNKTILNFLELNAAIATKRPNDKVKITLIRDENQIETNVQLSNTEINNLAIKGLELENLSENEKNQLNINYGLKIKSITSNRLKPYENDLRNAIVVSINNKKINNIENAKEIISQLDKNENIAIDILTRNHERLRLIL